ncbi:MAG: glutathione peroxidase [Prevotella sp.]|nr:glutathione peroxidase [Prevotella sp.]
MRKILCLLTVLLALNSTAKTRLYNITVKDGEGKAVKMKTYKGKVLLIVNTATRCGFTPQYKELENLYERYHAEGLEILDFPCNQFGQQAPGTNEEIHTFCTTNFNIQFPQFDKIDVNGEAASPLFVFLKSQQSFGGFDQADKRGQMMHQMLLKRDKDYAQKSDIKWNFTKFLVDRKGNVVRRFEPTDKMEDVEKAISLLLGK